MSKPEGRFKGIRGFFWLAIGLLFLVAGIAILVYLVFHLMD